MLRFCRGVDKSNRVVYPSLAFLGDGPSLGFPGERLWPFWPRWVFPCRILFGSTIRNPSWKFGPLYLLGSMPNTTRYLRMDEVTSSVLCRTPPAICRWMRRLLSLLLNTDFWSDETSSSEFNWTLFAIYECRWGYYLYALGQGLSWSGLPYVIFTLSNIEIQLPIAYVGLLVSCVCAHMHCRPVSYFLHLRINREEFMNYLYSLFLKNKTCIVLFKHNLFIFYSK